MLGSARLTFRVTGLKTLVASTTASRRRLPGQTNAQESPRVTLFATPPVDVGRVKEVDPELQSAVHDLEAFFLVGVPPEVHGAQTNITDQNSVLPQMLMFDCHLV